MTGASDEFQVELAVRDYECDLQGVVNNAVYLNYLEHARHRFMTHRGLDFADLHRRGIDPVVTRVDIRYRKALRPGDLIRVCLAMRAKGRFRLVFDQRIERLLPDATFEVVALAEVEAAVVSGGRPAPVASLGISDPAAAPG